jgi:seryl-tRNA synthetase
VHTLNGTAMAVPRIIIALIENGVRIVDGKVEGLDLPIALKPFWIGGAGRDVVGLRWV